MANFDMKPLNMPVEPLSPWLQKGSKGSVSKDSVAELVSKLNEVIAKLNYVCGYIAGFEERLRESVVNGSVVMRIAGDSGEEEKKVP